jgi:hypothetical protein
MNPMKGKCVIASKARQSHSNTVVSSQRTALSKKNQVKVKEKQDFLNLA